MEGQNLFTRCSRVYIEKKNSTISIRVRWGVRAKKFETYFNLGLKWDELKWDKVKQKPKNNTVCGDINYRVAYENIENWLNAIKDSFDLFEKQAKIPDKDQLRKSVLDIIHPQKNTKSMSLKTMFEDFMNQASFERSWEEKTHYKYQQIWGDLQKVCPTLLCEDFNENTMLCLKRMYIENGYSNTTSAKRVKFIKSFVRWANQHGASIDPSVLNYKLNLKVIPKTVTFLKYKELIHFNDFQFQYSRHCKARDMFCFMAFTSLRYSDVSNLCWENIHENYIELVLKKTCEIVKIPLIDLAKQLLQKRGNGVKKGKVFDTISDQKLNKYLKEAAEIAGLDREVTEHSIRGVQREFKTSKFYEIITAHDARRTFVCCSLAFGMTPEAVMSCTGHADYRSMKPYIEVADETQVKELSKWNRGSDTFVSGNSELDELWTSLPPEKRDAAMVMLKALAN